MRDDRRPLAGVRVLDLTRVLAGPYCTMILADLGAHVIKVERPNAGDDTRSWGPPFVDDMSAYFASVNRNKRSLSLDIAEPAGREVLDRLLERSDAVIENFLPETADRLRLTTDHFRSVNPRIIVCSITGFGRTGPWRNLPGYDFVVQALSGLMSITGEPNGPPMKTGVATTDLITGLYAAVSVVSLLLQRTLREARAAPSPRDSADTSSASSNGTVELALFDCTLASLVNVAQACLVTGQRPARYGNAHSQIVPYQCFETADGHIVLAVGNDGQWNRFCTAAGCDDLASDPRFATNPGRVAAREQLVPCVASRLRQRTTREWQVLLDRALVPNAPVLGVDEALALPQVRARGMISDVTLRGGSSLPLVASPIRFGDVPEAVPPPRLGQHSDEILLELGYGPAEVAELRRSAVIGDEATCLRRD